MNIKKIEQLQTYANLSLIPPKDCSAFVNYNYTPEQAREDIIRIQIKINEIIEKINKLEKYV